MTENNPSPTPDLNVLIIDTHVLLRQTVSKILRHLKDISKIHSVPSIEENHIMTDISRLQPDVIFLGMDTPDSKEMNILKIIREEYPMIPIILMTPLSPIGAKTALKGLKMGAVEYITKPDKNAGIMLATRHFQKRVVPIMKVIHELNSKLLLESRFLAKETPGMENKPSSGTKKSYNKIELMVVAGCTGGVNALFDLVKSLPDEISVPVVVIQHMPKIYTRELSEELDNVTGLNVREAQNDSPLIAGQIYVAPGGYHTIVKNDGNRRRIFIHKGPKENQNRPSINVTLRSIVQTYNDKVLTLYLSGGGADGAEGAKHIMKAGGKVMLQNRDSALLWNLPEMIANENPSLPQIHIKQLGTEALKCIRGTSVKKRYTYSSDSATQIGAG